MASKQQLISELQRTGHWSNNGMPTYSIQEVYSEQRALDYLAYSIMNPGQEIQFVANGKVINSNYKVPEGFTNELDIKELDITKRKKSPYLEDLLKRVEPNFNQEIIPKVDDCDLENLFNEQISEFKKYGFFQLDRLSQYYLGLSRELAFPQNKPEIRLKINSENNLINLSFRNSTFNKEEEIHYYSEGISGGIPFSENLDLVGKSKFEFLEVLDRYKVKLNPNPEEEIVISDYFNSTKYHIYLGRYGLTLNQINSGQIKSFKGLTDLELIKKISF